MSELRNVPLQGAFTFPPLSEETPAFLLSQSSGYKPIIYALSEKIKSFFEIFSAVGVHLWKKDEAIENFERICCNLTENVLSYM